MTLIFNRLLKVVKGHGLLTWKPSSLSLWYKCLGIWLNTWQWTLIKASCAKVASAWFYRVEFGLVGVVVNSNCPRNSTQLR